MGNPQVAVRRRLDKVADDLGITPKELLKLAPSAGVKRDLRDNSMLISSEAALLRQALENQAEIANDQEGKVVTSTSTEIVRPQPTFTSREAEWRWRFQVAPEPRDVDHRLVDKLSEAISVLQTAGPGWIPEEVEQRGRNFAYRDLLDPREEIRVSFEWYQERALLTPEQRATNPELRFYRISRRTQERLEKYLSMLWLAVPNCALCGQAMPPRDRGRLNALIDGRATLPNPDSKRSQRRGKRKVGPQPLSWALMHDECRDVARATEGLWADLHKLHDDPERHAQERQDGYRCLIDEHYPVFVEKWRVTPTAAIRLVKTAIRQTVRE